MSDECRIKFILNCSILTHLYIQIPLEITSLNFIIYRNQISYIPKSKASLLISASSIIYAGTKLFDIWMWFNQPTRLLSSTSPCSNRMKLLSKGERAKMCLNPAEMTEWSFRKTALSRSSISKDENHLKWMRQVEQKTFWFIADVSNIWCVIRDV